jgi:hypothetical protein
MIKLKSLIIEEMSDSEWRSDWLRRHEAKFTNDGRLIAYHGTTPKNARIIKGSGFKEGSNFTLKPEYAKSIASTYHDLDETKIVVFTVYLPLDSIGFVSSDIVSNRFINFKETI